MTAIAVETLVTVFGGSGFLGRHVVRALAKRGYRIRVAVRRPELAGHLQPLGQVGQIHAVQANLRYAGSVEEAARDCDALINLVGILFERGQQRFDAVHAAGAEAVARAAAGSGARLVHVSAIGADERSPSQYARGWRSLQCPPPWCFALPSCSALKTTSSTDSLPWRASRRRCP